jgi:transposase
MIRIDFTDAQILELDYERYHYPDPRIQKRMNLLYLKGIGLKHQQICSQERVTKATLAKYLKIYKLDGISGLKVLNYKGSSSELNAHVDTLKAYFSDHPPHTIAQAIEDIKRLTGVRRSPTAVRNFIKRIGMKFIKAGSIPGKAMTEKKLQEQDVFEKQELQPKLAEAAAGNRAVFFVDAAHFVFGSFLGYLWCLVRQFIPSPSGRQRFNVLGALNAVTREMTVVTNDSYINAHSVGELILKVAQSVIQTGMTSITLVMDNAKYQKCKLIQDIVSIISTELNCEIELLYLPSYSPNLNLIERYWKFIKKEALNSRYYSSFGDFKMAINNCISNPSESQKEQLKSLLTWNFQSFRKVQISLA